MRIDIEEQIELYAQWVERRAGVPLRRQASDLSDLDPGRYTLVDEMHHDPLLLEPSPFAASSGWQRVRCAAMLPLAVALVLVIVSVGIPVPLNGEGESTRTTSSSSLASGYAHVTWFDFKEGAENRPNVEPHVEDSTMACRVVQTVDTCDGLVGSRLVRYQTGDGADDEVRIYTEYGLTVSNAWQFLMNDGAVDTVGRYAARVEGRDLSWLVGFEPSPETRVLVFGALGHSREDVLAIATNLRPVTESLRLPIVFGEAEPSAGEVPDGAVGARYFAGYVDTTETGLCLGGIGVPWNNPETCVVVTGDTIQVTVASPSPTGTILIASVPVGTSRVEVLSDGPQSRSLPVVAKDSVRLGLVFADLDGFIPSELVAYSADGIELTRSAVSTTGGAPLGYLGVN